jgi:SAM-dependent methyltransferase
MKPFNTPLDIQELANQFRASRVFLTAYELGIFTAVGDGSKTSEEVAKEIKTNPRATDRLMNALVTLSLLNKTHGKFSNTGLTAKHLVKGKPGYMAGLSHIVNLWDNWSTMTESVRRGTSAFIRKTVNERGEDWLEAFIAAMHSRKQQAVMIAEMLDFTDVSSVIDIAGGSGLFVTEFLRRKPDMKAFVFDLPNVIPITEKYIRQEGFEGKVKMITGDYLKDDLGSGYDIAFLSAIIHSNSPDENKLLFSKCYKALNKNGKLVVVDWIMDESRTSPEAGAMFALNMLVATEAGDTYTESEVKNWMEETGFGSITRQTAEGGLGIVTGVKN